MVFPIVFGTRLAPGRGVVGLPHGGYQLRSNRKRQCELASRIVWVTAQHQPQANIDCNAPWSSFTGCLLLPRRAA